MNGKLSFSLPTYFALNKMAGNENIDADKCDDDDNDINNENYVSSLCVARECK